MPITDPIGMCSDMVKLAKVWKKVSEYPQMKVLLKFNENTKLFLASYFFRFDEDNITEEFVEPILECLLRLFSLLELVDVGYSSKYFKTFLFGTEVKLVSKSTTVDAITQDFNEHIRSNWDKETIWAALHDYDGNVLVYLNEFLFAKEKGLSFTLGTKYDIEHIMPYSGNNLQEIRKDAEIDSEEEFYGVVNKLGNKILLEEKINRAIGNEWFRTKVSTKLENKTGYIDSKYPIARALVAVVSLPQCAFAHFGAGVKASVIFVRKRKDSEKPNGDEAIFMAAPELIGYDATGRKTESQLDEIVSKYEEFRKDATPFFA